MPLNAGAPYTSASMVRGVPLRVWLERMRLKNFLLPPLSFPAQ